MEEKTLPNQVFFDYVLSRLSEGQRVNIPLTGTSMSPALREGRDNLVLAPVALGEPLQRCDVVLFRHHGTYILHRIVKIKGDTLVARGDALVSTETLQRADVVAKLVAVQNAKTGKVLKCSLLRWKWRTFKGVVWKPFKRKIKSVFK